MERERDVREIQLDKGEKDREREGGKDGERARGRESERRKKTRIKD